MLRISTLPLVMSLVAAPAFAQDIPLNTTSGGSGDVVVDGQAVGSAGALAGTSGLVIAAGVLLVVAVVASDDDDVAVTSTTN